MKRHQIRTLCAALAALLCASVFLTSCALEELDRIDKSTREKRTKKVVEKTLEPDSPAFSNSLYETNDPHEIKPAVTDPVASEPAVTEPATTEPAPVCELEYSLNQDKTSVTITGIGNYTDAVLEIPKTINGYRVTSIYDYAFYNCHEITEVIIPSSVIDIGENAFNGCKNLKSVILEDGVEIIHNFAFYNCPLLTEILIPNSIKILGARTFPFSATLYNLGTEPVFDLANMYYYSEQMPTEGGNYWRYVNGIPTVWEQPAQN